MRILFVCLGNICRSPLAEALFIHKIWAHGMSDQFEVDSCGTSNYNLGDSPDQRTVRNALKNGLSMDHVARQMTLEDFDSFDRILVMDGNNLRQTLSISEARHHSKIALIRTYDPMGSGDVPDPYYGGEKDFQEVFEMLDRSVEALVHDLIAKERA
jgi:protein-tyrosine phosphatase